MVLAWNVISVFSLVCNAGIYPSLGLLDFMDDQPPPDLGNFHQFRVRRPVGRAAVIVRPDVAS